MNFLEIFVLIVAVIILVSSAILSVMLPFVAFGGLGSIFANKSKGDGE